MIGTMETPLRHHGDQKDHVISALSRKNAVLIHFKLRANQPVFHATGCQMNDQRDQVCHADPQRIRRRPAGPT